MEIKLTRLTKAEKKKLLEIAMKASFAIEDRGDLERHGNDEEDFLEIGVGAIEWMLEEAYRQGKESVKKC